MTDVKSFIKDHIREFPLHYGCTSGGWPNDKNIKIDLISQTGSSFRVIIWFDEIVSKACSCIGPDNNEVYMNKVGFRITFDNENTYTIVHED